MRNTVHKESVFWFKIICIVLLLLAFGITGYLDNKRIQCEQTMSDPEAGDTELMEACGGDGGPDTGE